ncbi:MAG TPA: CotH kinase family protein, partial [Verrucomicrobiae bacterium]
SSAAMLDNGTRGDAVAGDGIYSAAIPGQPANSIVAFYIEATDNAAIKATSVAPVAAPAKECLVRFGEPLVGPGFTGSYTFPSYRMWMTAAVRDNWHNLPAGVPRMNKSHQDMTFVYGNQRVIYNAGAAWSGGFYSSGFMDYNRPDDHTCGYELDFPLNQKFLGSDEAVFDWPVWGQKNTGPTQRAGQYEQIGLWLAEQFGIQSMNRRFFHLFVNGVHQSSRPLMQKTYWGFPDHNYDWVEASLGAKIYEDIQQPGSDFVSEWFPNDSKGELYKIAEWFEYPGANPDVEISPSDRHWPVIDNYSRKKSVYRFWWEKRANGISMDYSKLYALFDSFLLPRSDEYSQAVYNWEVASDVDIEQWMKVFAFEDSIGDYDSFGNGWKNSYLYKPTKDKWKVLIWDLDASLGDYATWGPSTPTDPPIITAGPLIDTFQFVPLVRRAYWRQLKSQTAAGGPMDNAALNAQIDGRQAAFQADQIKAGELGGVPDSLVDAKRDAAAIKSWIASRRTFLAAKIPAASFAITSAGGSTSQNPFPVQGSAPVDVTRITVSINGGGDIDYPITWGPSRETSWKTGVRLAPGVATTLTFKAFNSSGTQLGSSSLSVSYSGTIQYPATGVVINEHMVNNTSFLADPNAIAPYGPWLELHNTTILPFDLSNYGLTDDPSNKSKFVFPANTLIPPGGFLLVWVDSQNTPLGASDIHCDTFSMSNPTAGTTSSIYLYTPDTGQLVDSDSYSTQAPNVSRRRLPNANGPLSNGNINSPATPRRYNR